MPTNGGLAPAAGAACSGCDLPITSAGVEHEVYVPGAGTFRFHRACFALWRAEVDGWREISGGSAASPWALLFDLTIEHRAARDRAAHQQLRAACAEIHLRAAHARAEARTARAAVRRKA